MAGGPNRSHKSTAVPPALSAALKAAEVRTAVNGILDPCGAAIGASIGLADMGIVDSIDVNDGAVTIRLLPTSPGCLYTGVFDAEIQKRVRALAWCTRVEVSLTDGDEIWTEERLSGRGRAQLQARRRSLRRPPVHG